MPTTTQTGDTAGRPSRYIGSPMDPKNLTPFDPNNPLNVLGNYAGPLNNGVFNANPVENWTNYISHMTPDAYGYTAQNALALQNFLPGVQGAINDQVSPAAQSQFNAANLTSPQYNDLMLKLFQKYGPQLNAVGNQIQGQNMQGQVANQNAALMGGGTDLLKNAYAASQIFDKPWFDSRQAGATGLQNLLGSIDLSGNLSGSEQNQIGQGLARQDIQRGTLNSPSQNDIVSNAMQYGNAAYQRKQSAQSMMSQAINNASQFLPSANSGVNVLNQATGQNAPANTGQQQFQGVNTQNMGNQVGSNLLGGIQGLSNTSLHGGYQTNMNNANIKANQKDWADYLGQVVGSVGSLVGGIAGAVCWVAREVYGESNPRWTLFRYWMLNYSPKWFRYLYLKHGEKFAKYIQNKPLIKSIIAKWMDTKVWLTLNKLALDA